MKTGKSPASSLCSTIGDPGERRHRPRQPHHRAYPEAIFPRLIEAEPDIGEIIMRAFILRRVGLMRYSQGGVVLIGSSHSGDTLRIQRFLSRNGYPHRMLDTDQDPDAGGMITCLAVAPEQLPVVVLPDKEFLRNPTTPELADALGLTESFDADRVYDVTVVGAGPAGLAAAVYGASEGLDTLVIEPLAPGGQAGTSSKIENYLGFPHRHIGPGAGGARADPGAEVRRPARHLPPGRVHRLRSESLLRRAGGRTAHLHPLDRDRDRCQLPQARHPRTSTSSRGQGIHYAATWIEGNLCSNEEVIVVGGGNSAGPGGGVPVPACGSCAHAGARRGAWRRPCPIISSSASRLRPRSRCTPFTEVTGLDGDRLLERVTWTHRQTGESETKEIGNCS
jgi:thioredoxin reductase (NADPH)